MQVLQGQAGTTESLFARTSTFTTALADNGQLLEDLIENLNVAMGAVARDGTKFSELADGMERLVTGLAAEREPIGAAVDALSSGTSTLLDLLREARPPLAAPSINSTAWRPRWTPRSTASKRLCRRRRRTTANSSGSAPMAAS